MDDNVALAENIAEILACSGYRTAIAATAEQAFVQIEEGTVALLITEHCLPDGSGTDLIERINRSSRKIPAIVIACFVTEKLMTVAQAVGAITVLEKPLVIPKLMAAVRSVHTIS